MWKPDKHTRTQTHTHTHTHAHRHTGTCIQSPLPNGAIWSDDQLIERFDDRLAWQCEL